MTRLSWLLLFSCVVALAAGIVAAALVVRGSPSSRAPEAVSGPAFSSQRLVLPLAEDPSALMLASHDRNLLVGIAARPGGPVEVAALRAERPVATEDLSFRLGARAVEAKPCGPGCSRLALRVLAGSPAGITVRTDGLTLLFRLPARLPPAGDALFARVERTMGALRSFRYTERLSSGSAATSSEFEAQAPDRVRLRISTGFRSVIIGRKRWDYHDGRWEEGAFPGLRVNRLYMWRSASHARVLGRSRVGGRPVSILALYAREPVPAWFRLFVQPDGRVLEARMVAPSHFMRHRFGGFDRPLTIRPPRLSRGA